MKNKTVTNNLTQSRWSKFEQGINSLEKKEFKKTLNQISKYLSWGRRENVYVLGDEGDNPWNRGWYKDHKNMLEPHDVFCQKFDKGVKLIEKSGDNFIVSFRLPLYEEVFGSLKKKDFIYPGNENNAYDMYLEGYENLIKATKETLGKYGSIEQDKNIFTLTTNCKNWNAHATGLKSELWIALHDVLCF